MYLASLPFVVVLSVPVVLPTLMHDGPAAAVTTVDLVEASEVKRQPAVSGHIRHLLVLRDVEPSPSPAVRDYHSFHPALEIRHC
jgi:hypothetical protein